MCGSDRNGSKLCAKEDSMSHTQVRNEVEQACAIFARNANAKNLDALVKEFYAKDAVLLPPGQPEIQGIERIREFWKSMIDRGAGDVALQTKSVDASGDLAFEIGAFSFNMPDGKGGKTTVQGKYLVVFKRQPDGKLLAVADTFNMNE